MTPGIHTITNEAYHASEGISKSGLWKLYKRTPFHYRFSELKDETSAQRFGSAAHCAILEPNFFEPRFMRGPADRRGSKWTAAEEIAKAAGKSVVTESDYDNALRLRDVLQRDPIIQQLTEDHPAIEQSAYAIDKETSELIKCRPDIYSYKYKIIGDLKSTVDASRSEWVKRVENFGYFLQDVFYTNVWQAAGGGEVDAFVFITVEKDPPFAYQIFELEQEDIDEGEAVMRHSLARFHECMEKERELLTPTEAELATCWPGYSKGIQKISCRRWARKLTGALADGS